MIVGALVASITIVGAVDTPSVALDPEVLVVHEGRALAPELEQRRELQRLLEELLSSCGIARLDEAEWPDKTEYELSVELVYAEPVALEMNVPAAATLEPSRILLLVSSSRGGGWPYLYARHAAKIGSFWKCSGGGTLDLMCSPFLAPLIPDSVRRNCHLAPRYRSAHDQERVPTEEAAGTRDE